ncbi:MAG: hypothetical protein AAGH15_09520 [Myxococcota bacterium]
MHHERRWLLAASLFAALALVGCAGIAWGPPALWLPSILLVATGTGLLLGCITQLARR